MSHTHSMKPARWFSESRNLQCWKAWFTCQLHGRRDAAICTHPFQGRVGAPAWWTGSATFYELGCSYASVYWEQRRVKMCVCKEVWYLIPMVRPWAFKVLEARFCLSLSCPRIKLSQSSSDLENVKQIQRADSRERSKKSSRLTGEGDFLSIWGPLGQGKGEDRENRVEKGMNRG